MKKYIPSKMILNSRFKEYFSALDEIEQQKTLEHLTDYLMRIKNTRIIKTTITCVTCLLR